MRDRPLEHRTIVVTGAARGLGAAVARELARRGAHLALIGHEKTELEAVAAALPTRTLAIEADITDEAALEEAAALIRRQLGHPSAVVANAGIAQGGPFSATDMTAWRRVIDVNLTGSALTAHTFLPDLSRTAGHYLQVASLAAFGAAPMMSAYCASKAGVEAFAHALRAEVAQHGVTVGIAYLNWIDTDMIRDADQHAVLRELRAHMPAPARRVHPADLVAHRLAQAVEHRRTAVFVPAWLRLAHICRAALPPLVLRRSRHLLPRLQADQTFSPTGSLGAGGRADDTADQQRH